MCYVALQAPIICNPFRSSNCAIPYEGHIGVDLVEHTTSVLPGALMTSLQTLPADAPPSAVSALLAREIQAFDDALLKAVSDVFPERELERMTNDEISERMKDRDVERKVILASRGTTGANPDLFAD